MALWTEPARHGLEATRPLDAYSTTTSQHYSPTWLGGTAFTEIRRYVIVQEGHGNAICW